MQYYVPCVKIKKLPKLQIKSVFMACLFFLILLTVSITLGASRKTNKCFEKQSYHFVYAQNNKQILDKTEQDLVKSLGGAGIYYFYKEHHYLIVNVYLSKDDANEIKNGMAENFPNSGTITLEVKDIPKKIQSKIKDNLSYYKFFKYFHELIESFQELNMNYIAGKITQGKLMSSIITMQLDCKTIISEFENPENEELFNNIKTYANMCKIHFENFFDEFYQSTKKQALVCALGVNLALTKIDLFNNLQ